MGAQDTVSARITWMTRMISAARPMIAAGGCGEQRPQPRHQITWLNVVDNRSTKGGTGMSTRIRALSITQPWAWAIIHGKTVANRTRPTHHRGVLAIHAGKTWSGFGSGDRGHRVGWGDV